MTLSRNLKRQADKTYTGYDYTYDGAYSPRVKGQDKKRRQRDMRRYLKRITDAEIRGSIE
ncbi:hypothetical protein [Heyndrickxia sporothermodurans]|uniref:hypothetical protein n=1 Tax=Heyndrickxia sporothermodurans TaxID=46224 RepID=UPI000D3B9685|nr:hypothetical protein [Heyndrickxia sporothermodurans]PTY92962.1 hypothetical protein B5V90_02460 [Heyndrickxia sporothermodurans]